MKLNSCIKNPPNPRQKVSISIAETAKSPDKNHLLSDPVDFNKFKLENGEITIFTKQNSIIKPINRFATENKGLKMTKQSHSSPTLEKIYWLRNQNHVIPYQLIHQKERKTPIRKVPVELIQNNM